MFWDSRTKKTRVKTFRGTMEEEAPASDPSTLDLRDQCGTNAKFSEETLARIRHDELEKRRYHEFEEIRRAFEDLRKTVLLMMELQGFETYYTEYVPAQQPQLQVRKIKTVK